MKTSELPQLTSDDATAAAAPEACCAITDPGMGAEDAAVVAARFKALGDPARVRILNLLLRNERLCGCEMQPVLGLSQPTVSHHLRILRQAGLVDCEVEGRWAYYWANKPAIGDLAAILEVSA